MGSCKQLLPLEGKSVIVRTLEALLEGGIGELVVVVSPEGDAVAEAVRSYPVTVVRTADQDGDMAASVRAGRDALSPEISGVVIALCDHPLVSPGTVARLVELHANDPEAVIIPRFEKRNGHPTLFPRQLLDRLEPPLTMRDLVRDNPSRMHLLEVPDQGVLLDMDTPEDYRRIVALCSAR
jgi:CTP:molybdopterin cytidylyltransferase MocA